MRVWIYYKRYTEPPSYALGPWSFGDMVDENVVSYHDNQQLYGEDYLAGRTFDLIRGLYDLDTGQYEKWVWLSTAATAAHAKHNWSWWPW